PLAGDAMHIKPCRLSAHVSVVALLNVAGPPAIAGRLPSCKPRRRRQSKMSPSVAVAGMLDHAAKFPNSRKRRDKATGVVTQLVLVRLPRRSVPEPPPPLAWWMRDDRIRPGIATSVADLAPGIDAGLLGVYPIGLDVECGDHVRGSSFLRCNPQFVHRVDQLPVRALDRLDCRFEVIDHRDLLPALPCKRTCDLRRASGDIARRCRH